MYQVEGGYIFKTRQSLYKVGGTDQGKWSR